MNTAPKNKLPGVGRVAFLARLSEFKNLFDAGWPISVIYDHHKGSNTGLSYSQFARYIGKYVRKPELQRENSLDNKNHFTNPSIAPTTQQSKDNPIEKSRKLKKIIPFHHDPLGSQRDDLI